MTVRTNSINKTVPCVERAIARCVEQGGGEAPLLLVSGDMSGIQPFLYTIVPSKAAKNLKGRSRYIELLGMAVVRSLLEVLDLDEDHIVSESGGTFVLLAPNSPDVKAALDHAVRRIEQRIFAAHGTALGMTVASVPITEAEARGGTSTLALRWQELFLKREAKKNAKCAGLMLAPGGYGRFFEPKAVAGDKTDAITGEDLSDDGVRLEDYYVSRVNREIYDLGDALRNGREFAIEPAGLGVEFIVEKSEDKARVLTFEEMCESKNDSDFERLGVLRMDVDNLGSKFQEYAREQSLQAYSELSRELDRFFKEDVSRMCDACGCHLLYGGGDDLFVVGDWSKVIALAAEVRKAFGEWARERKGAWSLSGGVAIVKAKYPIIQGAKESGEEEDRAKDHSCHGEGKNSLSLMGTPLNWDCEFPAVENLKSRLVELLTGGALPKSFLSRVLMHLAKACMASHRVGKDGYSVYWQLSYDAQRAMERSSGEEAKELIDTYRNEVCIGSAGDKLGGTPVTTQYHPLELWALACRWAELEYRSDKG